MTPASVVDLAPDEETRSRYAKILLYPIAEGTDQIMAMAGQCLKRIRQSALRREFDELQSRIHSMPPDDPSISSLLQEAMAIRRKLDAFK